MSLIAKGGGNFTPAPEGLWPAVCVDVVDMGILKQSYNGTEKQVHKCRLVWEISEKMADGRRFIVGKRYTVSLHEKSGLHKDLKSWRGKAFTADELKGFDVEKVIGVPCRLLITHDEKDGTTYGNVTQIMKADKASAIVPNGTYIRVKDRDQAQQTVGNDKSSTVMNGNDPEAIDPFRDEPRDDGDPFNDPSYMDGSEIPF
jgi:hypothetical protein